jgi:Flp pilus assembly pilin Flp
MVGLRKKPMIFLRDESGISSIEYVVLGVIIILGILLVLSALMKKGT